MAFKHLDPAPRQYAPNVTLNRRGNGSGTVTGSAQSPETIEKWLLHEALSAQDMLGLVEEFCGRLTAAALPVSRLAMNVGTLHPQLIGFSWIWEEDDGFCDEIRVESSSLSHPSYINSPLYRTIEFGETIQGDPRNPDLATRYPIMADLAARGFADYLVAPLTPSVGAQQHRMAVSMASMQEGGLSGGNGQILARLLRLLAMHVARLTAVLVSRNIAGAYLGEAAASQVLDGSIQRGAGAPIEAVILVSDLRRSTEISGMLLPEAMLALLNAYFECLTEAIQAKGGEVLKFIGDGMLAVFPFSHFDGADTAARSAYDAATDALARIDGINADPPAALRGISGWQPLRTGLALHAGEVFFGNIGSTDRLDFTVIGPAVNVAARVESMTKELQRPLLVTAPVAMLLAEKLEPLGSFGLRGIADPLQLFAPRTTRTEKQLRL
jgi:adenylate cyclase